MLHSLFVIDRDWFDYERGFGNLRGNFWIGLRNLYKLTNQSTELHVYLEAFNGTTAYARYRSFAIADHSDKYRLSVDGYSGDAGDSMQFHDQMQFSTRDSDSDDVPNDNCAVLFEGAWWYKDCHYSNLNGKYYDEPEQAYGHGINWFDFRGHEESLKYVVMKIRRL